MRRLAWALAVVVVLASIGFVGAAWYFSGEVIKAPQATTYPLTVSNVDAATVTLPRDPQTAAPGRYGLSWPDGHARLGVVVRSDVDTVTRNVEMVERGQLTKGLKVALDPYVHDGDPRTAHGLDFADIRYAGDLGAMPAWHVPAKSSTWVVFVHGSGATRAAALRTLPALHAAGYPVLVPSYRNDPGAPAAPDGNSHLGGTEWRDVDAAMRWAAGQGAEEFVLYGESLGGAIVMQVADRSDFANQIKAVVLDSPVLDWLDVIDYRAGLLGVPRPLTWTAEQLVAARIGVAFDRFDWVARASDVRKPVLIFHSAADANVPVTPSQRLAAERRDLVTLVDIAGADHVQGWNADQPRFERELLGFLARISG